MLLKTGHGTKHVAPWSAAAAAAAGTAGSTGCFDPAARRASHRRHSRQMARQS